MKGRKGQILPSRCILSDVIFACTVAIIEDDMPNHRRTRNNQKLKSLFTQYISPAFDAGLFRCEASYKNQAI